MRSTRMLVSILPRGSYLRRQCSEYVISRTWDRCIARTRCRAAKSESATCADYKRYGAKGERTSAGLSRQSGHERRSLESEYTTRRATRCRMVAEPLLSRLWRMLPVPPQLEDCQSARYSLLIRGRYVPALSGVLARMLDPRAPDLPPRLMAGVATSKQESRRDTTVAVD